MSTSDKLWKMVMEFSAKHPDSTGNRARLDLGDMALCAEFAEQAVRECAEIAAAKDYRVGDEILHKFGLKE